MRKTILITGGSSGIGKSIGDFLFEKGFDVYGTSRFPKKYTDSKFPLLELDVADTTSINRCVKNLLKKVDNIDVLINNAGVGITGPMEEIPIEEMKKNFDINLFGPIQMINSVLPQMRLKKSLLPQLKQKKLCKKFQLLYQSSVQMKLISQTWLMHLI